MTHHIQNMNMSYSCISRYGIHDLIQHPDSGHLGFWISGSQILDLWIWRSGGSDLDLGVQTPRDPPDTPKAPHLDPSKGPIWGQ